MRDSASISAPRSGGRRPLLLLFLAGAACAFAGIAFYHYEKRAELSPVAQGQQLVADHGCYACHGRGESDVRANFRRTTAGAWRPKSIPTFWENGIAEAEVLADWIANGVPAKEAEEHKRLFIQMPAYRDFMTSAEIDAVAAWILAEGLRLSGGMGNGDRNTPLPDATGAPLTDEQLFLHGDRLSREHGCYQCHGELGQGGVANPASFKDYIPGFFGDDFRKLTAGGRRDEVLHWIEHGRGRAIESGLTGRLAQHFFHRQAIDMPAYRDRLTRNETSILTDYVLLLNRAGPLSARELEQRFKTLEAAVDP